MARAQGSGRTVTLDVGGRLFKTLESTLEAMPTVAALVKSRGQGADGPVFLDQDPETFRILLDIARGQPKTVLEHLSPVERLRAMEDAAHFQMPALRSPDGVPPSKGDGRGAGRAARSRSLRGRRGSAVHTAPSGFEFRLLPSNNGKLSDDGKKVFTCGLIGKHSVALGDRQVPMEGRTFWEVKVLKSSSNLCSFVGVASPTVKSSSWGWGFTRDETCLILRDDPQQCGLLPVPQEGTLIGVEVDRERGALSFWKDGKFLVAVAMGLEKTELVPLLSVHDDGVLEVVSGLTPPDLRDTVRSA